jgi:hypothetical protein
MARVDIDLHCVDQRLGVDGDVVADKRLGAEKRRIVSKADGSALTSILSRLRGPSQLQGLTPPSIPHPSVISRDRELLLCHLDTLKIDGPIHHAPLSRARAFRPILNPGLEKRGKIEKMAQAEPRSISCPSG